MFPWGYRLDGEMSAQCYRDLKIKRIVFPQVLTDPKCFSEQGMYQITCIVEYLAYDLTRLGLKEYPVLLSSWLLNTKHKKVRGLSII